MRPYTTLTLLIIISFYSLSVSFQESILHNVPSIKLLYPTVSNLGPGSSYQWSVSPGFQGYNYSLGNGYFQVSLVFYTTGYYSVTINATSACGDVYQAHMNVYAYNCGGSYYKASPNPATSDLTISGDEEELKRQNIEKSSDQSIKKIIIMDKLGNALIQQSHPYKESELKCKWSFPDM